MTPLVLFPVLVPLLAAAALVSRPPRTARAAARATLVALGTTLLAALALAAAVGGGRAPAVAMPALGLGVVLRGDGIGAAVAVAVAASALLAVGAAARARTAPPGAAFYSRALALTAVTEGGALAADLGAFYACAEIATLAAVLLVADEHGAGDGRDRALRSLALLEAGGLVLLTTMLLVHDAAGDLGFEALRYATAELRTNPLYGAMIAGATLAAASRLAPWALTADGPGAPLLGGTGLALAAILTVRLAPALGGTAAWRVGLVALGVAAIGAAWRARRAGPATGAPSPSLLEDVALGARLIWRPFAAPRLRLTLLAAAVAAAGAAALALGEARAGGWPGVHDAAAWLAAGAAWPPLALAALLVRPFARRASAAIAACAALAAATFATSAAVGVAIAVLCAGTVALWPALESPDGAPRSGRAGAPVAVLVAALALLHAVARGAPPATPSAWLLLAPLALPVAAAGMLLALGDGALGRARAIAGAALGVNLAVVAALYARADAGAPLALVLGAAPAPLGLHLLLDRLAGEVLVIAVLAMALLFVHALECGADRGTSRFHALGQLQLFGLAGAVLAADLVELSLFLAVALAAAHARLVADGPAASAARRHLGAAGAAGVTLLLGAVGVVYAALGATGYGELALAVPAVPAGAAPLLRLGEYVIVVALALQAAALPLGAWLSRAFAAQPPAAAGTIVVAVTVATSVLLRLYTLVFPCLGVGPCGPAALVLPFGLATLTGAGIASLAATTRRDLAAPLLLLATGTALVGGGSFRADGLAAALFALAAAAPAGLALAVVAGGADPPRAARLGTVALVAALGMPPFPGWLARVAVLAAASADALVVWSLTLTSALFATLAVGRAVLGLGADAPTTSAAVVPPRALAAALVLLVALTLAAAPALRLAERGARELLDRPAYVAALLGEHAATGR